MWLTLLAACLTSADEYAALQDQLKDQDGDGVLGRDDCDDHAAAVHPGLEEVPGDGLDNDCDPSTSDELTVIDTWTGEISAGELDSRYGAGAYYGLGTALVLTDTDGDGRTDLLASAPRDRTHGPDTGAIYAFIGPWRGGPAEDAPALYGDELALGEFGAQLVAGADGTLLGSGVSADEAGVAWLLTGTDPIEFATTAGPSGFPTALALWSAGRDLVAATDTSRGGGELYLWSAREVPWTIDLLLPAQEGTTQDEDYGASLATADLDGDGADELLVGAPGADGGAGRVYAVRELDTDSYAADLWQGAGGSGRLLSSGDLNGDGYTDLIAGGDASTRVAFGSSRGGDLDRSDVLLVAAGSALCGSSDLNGDGNDDLVVGVEADGEGGAVYVFYELAAGLGLDDAGLVIRGRAPTDALGRSLACGADLDDDGVEDVVLGAPDALGASARGGVVYLLPGGGA